MKRVINKTLIVFVVALMSITNLGLNIKANEGLNTNNETQEIKEFSVSSTKDSFLSGEEVIVDFNLELTDDIGGIKDSVIEVSIPKKYVIRESIIGSGIMTSEYTVDVVESGDKYIVRYNIKLVTSGNDFRVPLKFKTSPLLTPNNHVLNLEGKYTYGEQSVSSNIEVPINTGDFRGELHVSDEPFLGHSNQDGRILNAGIIDENKPGYISTNTNKLNTIKASYIFKNIIEVGKSESFGDRRFEELKVDFKIPEGAKFIERNGWKYNQSTHTATLIDKGPDINVGEYSVVEFKDIYMQFPGEKIGSSKTLELTITGIPYEKGINEENVIVKDTRMFILGGEEEKLTEFNAHKLSNDEMVDHISDRNKEINWIVSMDKNFSENELTNFMIKDYNLDQRLKYDGVTVVSHGFYSTMKVDIDVRLNDDTIKNIVRGYRIIESKRFNFKDENIKEVIIKPSKGFKLSSMEKIELRIHTSLIDKKSEIGIVESDNRFYNHAKFEVQYKDEPQQLSDVTAWATIKSLDSKAYLERKNIDNSKNYFVNEKVDMSLTIKAEDIVENHDELELDSLIEILPDGIHYLENSAIITVGNNVVSTLKDGSLEPKVVYDYKGTGKTALIWKLDTISLKGQGNLIKNTEALISINYKSVITEFTEKGKNSFEAYLKLDNNKQFPAKHGVEDKLNIGDNEGNKIEYNKESINYIPTKEFFIKKEVKGSLNDNYRLTPNVAHTEINEELTYRVTIMNNKEKALEDIYLLDILPFEGDGVHSINKKRQSTFSLALKGPITVPEEFNVFYTNEKPIENLKEYYNGNHWSSSMTDYTEVRAIKLELKDGASLKSEYKKQFEMTFIVPKGIKQNKDHQAVNSILSARSKNLDFIESNTATAKLSQYLIEGTIFQDIDKDGKYDDVIDKVFESIKVGLYHKDNTPVLGYDGEPVIVSTNSKGYYAFGILNEGSYKIKIIGLKEYTVTDLGDLSNVYDSHLNHDRSSKIVNLNSANRKETLNAGLYKELIEFKVEKVWVDGPDVHPTIEVQLYRNNEVFGNPVSLENGETSHTWTDLDKTDSEGVDYEYTVDEFTVLENYKKDVDGSTITNKYVSPKTSFTVNKVWANGPDVHPIIEVQLYRNDEAYGNPISLENGETSHSWIDLDKTDSKGVDYEYTVDELTELENYSKDVDGSTITNTYISPKTSFTVNKVWVDGPDVHPSIEVQLYRNNEVFGDSVSLENGETSHTWTDLDKTDSEGVDYEYTVDELTELENYSKEVDRSTITNKYVSPKTSFTINKVWVDGPDVHPTIEIQLYRNDEAFGNPVSLENGETSYTWTDLDKTDSKGVDYEYTVDELTKLEYYTKEVKGQVITNTYSKQVLNDEKDKLPKPESTDNEESKNETPNTDAKNNNDTKDETPTSEVSNNASINGSPNTGLSNSIVGYLNILIISVLTIILSSKKKRKI